MGPLPSGDVENWARENVMIPGYGSEESSHCIWGGSGLLTIDGRLCPSNFPNETDIEMVGLNWQGTVDPP